MSTPEHALAQFVAETTYGDLPADAPETVTQAVVDTVGVTLAGAVEGAGAVAADHDDIGEDADAATLLGLGTEDPERAALRVGTAAHALDYDDLSWALDGHPSVTLVPPLFALADDHSGRELVTAFAVGFEVECAVAGPISPSHYEAGWHATATFGTFGAAAAAASLLDFDAATAERALNAAASMPAGTKRNFGSMTKPLHAGLCARSGMTAALLAAEGLTTSATAVSGDQGFWDLYGPEPASAFSFGDEWALDTEGIHAKAYPCCYFTHTAIAATQALTDDIDPEAIDHIEVTAAGGAGDALTYPDPETGLEAKFSMEHAVACAAARDRVDLAAFEADALADETVAGLRERVAFSVDESLPYDSHEATVRVTTDDGTVERRQENPPGVHTNPLSPARRKRKFDDCARRAVEPPEADRLYDMFTDLTAVDDIGSVV